MVTRIKTDEGILKDVVDSLYWDSRVDASKVSVRVNDGIVTLSGTVPSYSTRVAALEDTWVITGVRDVKNELTVDIQAESPADSEIKSNVEHSFAWDTELYPFEIKIDVVEGWVTLEGTVDAFWKKVRAEDLAYSRRGVIGVTNKIAVVPTQTLADESLADTIINALDRNPTVNVDDINVTVEKGIVSLSGSAPNWSAKRTAHDIARYTRGVKDVDDRITVR
jgi:osmotically-inducible protein OsmY